MSLGSIIDDGGGYGDGATSIGAHLQLVQLLLQQLPTPAPAAPNTAPTTTEARIDSAVIPPVHQPQPMILYPQRWVARGFPF